MSKPTKKTHRFPAKPRKLKPSQEELPVSATVFVHPAKPVVLSYDLDMTNPNRKNGPHCVYHPETALVCPRCIASKGGKKSTPIKAKAARKNAAKARKAKLAKIRPIS